jgi:gamma-glutamylcyclotransferase
LKLAAIVTVLLDGRNEFGLQTATVPLVHRRLFALLWTGKFPGRFLTVHYFAYGSNMNWPQMQRRCPSAQFVCVGRLAGYHFGITRHSRLRNCGTANVYPVNGKEVWGIVYDITEQDLLVLDGFEDGYRREILPVYPSEDGGPPLNALVYVAALENNVPRPNAEYRRLIVEGARHWKLPPAYLALLEAIQVEAEKMF